MIIVPARKTAAMAEIIMALSSHNIEKADQDFNFKKKDDGDRRGGANNDVDIIISKIMETIDIESFN